MYDNILYPTDGSAGADAALEHAHDLARQHDATVHILHVVDSGHLGYETDDELAEEPPSMLPDHADECHSGMARGRVKGEKTGMIGEDPGEYREEVKQRANAIVDDVARRLEDVDTTTHACVGKPHQIILSYADHHDIDIIVMGTHGRTGVERYLIGSVTEKVVRLSDVPVVTVRQRHEPAGDTEQAA